jgi:histidyl-tRNA synthetase
MKWAADQGARFCVIYGAAEREAGTATVRDMDSGEQVQVPPGEIAAYVVKRCAEIA